MSYKASDMVPGANTSFLFKSPYGFGKTIAACSAAIYGPVRLNYFDKTEPIELLNFFRKIGRPELLKNIDIETYGSGTVHQYVNFLRGLIKKKIAGETCEYAAVITDSVTFLTSAAVGWSMSFRTGIDLNNPSGYVPGFDDYKTETSLVIQALDICRELDTMSIWTGHPIESLDVQGKPGQAQSVGNVKKTNKLVSYGSKVGSILPGGFNEIYHFSRSGKNRIVLTDALGDEFAKTSIALPKSIDFTDKLFFEVWQNYVNHAKKEAEKGNYNPFKDFGGETESGSSKWDHLVT